MAKDKNKDKQLRKLKESSVEFDLRVIDPKEFTKENIQRMTDNLSKTIALEASHAIEIGLPVDGFHIRLGGGHSRTFSKTSGHKNVIHSRSGGAGSGTFP